MTPDRLFTLAQLAARWQVSRQTLHKWIDADCLRVTRLSRRIWRVSEAEVARFESRYLSSRSA